MKKSLLKCRTLFTFIFFTTVTYLLLKTETKRFPYFLKKCIQNAGVRYLNGTNRFFQEFSKCIHQNIPINVENMDNFANNVIGEKKVFLPLKIDDFQEEECIWLTIGIGGSAVAETAFKKKYSHCKVFGVEPGRVGNYSSVGSVIPFAVGLENVWRNTFESKKPNVISLTNILDNYVNSRFIYYLTIDIEGYEYKILESLVGNGKFVNEGITFCQIDAELHNIKMNTIHPDVRNLNPVEFIFNFLQDSSPYIPIFNEPYTFHPHQKITFINIIDSRCEKAFSFSAIFN